MYKEPKIKVAVIYGGKSGEHEVSLLSAVSIIGNLNPDRYEVIPIGIDKQGTWHISPINEVYFPKDKMLLPKALQSQQMLVARCGSGRSLQANFIVDFDVAFPILHGPMGEDGTVQGLLELANVPYVGAGVLTSALGMDKDMTRRIIIGAGIPAVPYSVLHSYLTAKQRANAMLKIVSEYGYPLFVKPARMGSSVGISKVKQWEGFAPAVTDAFRYDNKILIEKGLQEPHEIEFSVLENLNYGEEPMVSVPGEIRPREQHEFYSYEAKYVDPVGADLLIPAKLPKVLAKQAQSIARGAFSALECQGMARVDLFIDKETDDIYFNEINTLPGFTTISMYPKLWEASDLSYGELLSKLIELALARHERKQQLLSDYENKL